MGRSSVFEWHKLFCEGREQVEDDQRSERPSTSKSDENLVKMKNLLSSDRRLNERMICELWNLPKTSVHKIVTENLGMRKVCAKLVPTKGVDRWIVRQTCEDLSGILSRCTDIINKFKKIRSDYFPDRPCMLSLAFRRTFMFGSRASPASRRRNWDWSGGLRTRWPLPREF